MEIILASNDFVGISFWLATGIMLASTVFFLIERADVPSEWKTSLTISALVTGIAFWHYLYMRSMWISTGTSPTVYRYVDWLITVPLQIVEFYFILRAVTKVKSTLFWQLLISSIVMLVGGYLGEANYIDRTAGFVIGMLGWAGVIYLIFVGEAAKASTNSENLAGQKAFKSLRIIVFAGWSIYPAGYLFAIDSNIELVNIIYNFADLVNKTTFGLVIWAAAKSDLAKRT